MASPSRIKIQSLKFYPSEPPVTANTQKIIQSLWADQKKFIILSGPPGVGKSRAAQEIVMELMRTLGASQAEDAYRLSELFPDFLQKSYSTAEIEEIILKRKIQFVWEFSVLHPQYTYEDLIRGNRLQRTASGSEIVVREGVLGFISRVTAIIERTVESNGQPHGVLILDEINRAPIGQLFGEALFALERRGTKVLSPYVIPGEGSHFSIPQSLLIVGTMNSIDRATAGFDLALRRRFTIVPVGVSRDAIQNHLPKDWNLARASFLGLFDALKELVLKSSSSGVIPLPELVMGHSFFLPPKSQMTNEAQSIDWLATSYLFQILPTLLDYKEQGLIDFNRDLVGKIPGGEAIEGKVAITDVSQESIRSRLRT